MSVSSKEMSPCPPQGGSRVPRPRLGLVMEFRLRVVFVDTTTSADVLGKNAADNLSRNCFRLIPCASSMAVDTVNSPWRIIEPGSPRYPGARGQHGGGSSPFPGSCAFKAVGDMRRQNPKTRRDTFSIFISDSF